jgi:hypothetical protein
MNNDPQYTQHNSPEQHPDEVSKEVVEQKDDKPAARGIWIAIFVAIAFLAIWYFIFYKAPETSMNMIFTF